MNHNNNNVTIEINDVNPSQSIDINTHLNNSTTQMTQIKKETETINENHNNNKTIDLNDLKYEEMEFIEDEEILDRLEECGIMTKEKINTIDPRKRKDDELSREMRKLNIELMEKRKYINECRRKMREYYYSIVEKKQEFDLLLIEERKIKPFKPK